MAEQSELFRRQYEFAAHIRAPEERPRPEDVEERRMAIYRSLFYNNVESLLANNFPVLHRLLPEEHWHGMVRAFLVRHRCQTPLFTEIGQEFLDYLQNERGGDPGDPPFLLELAHYEWVELALSISVKTADPGDFDPNGDLMSAIPVVSPVSWSLSYKFPVHRIGPDLRPEKPGDEPTRLVVYRDRRDEVQFLKINAVTQRLLQLLQENPDWTGQDTVKRITAELCHPRPERVMEAGRQILNDLRARNIILGTRRTPS